MARETPIAWVVGAGGLLGRAVVAEATAGGARVHRSQVPWEDAGRAGALLAADADALLSSHTAVDLFWCAGAGVVATAPEALQQEYEVLTAFLAALGSTRRRHSSSRLRVFLASSAGGVYAGSDELPFSEAVPPRPNSPYGVQKLKTERAAEAFGIDEGVPVFIGRISNLYGPGQNLDKPQGLITQLCRAHLQRTPLMIYVPLDTARDYLYVRDAARMVLGGVAMLDDDAGPVVKILASQASSTLATVIGELRRLTKRRPPIVLGASPSSAAQARHLRFRSTVWPELDRFASTTLAAGMSKTLASVAAQLHEVRPVG